MLSASKLILKLYTVIRYLVIISYTEQHHSDPKCEKRNHATTVWLSLVHWRTDDGMRVYRYNSLSILIPAQQLSRKVVLAFCRGSVEQWTKSSYVVFAFFIFRMQVLFIFRLRRLEKIILAVCLGLKLYFILSFLLCTSANAFRINMF
jgi:hypothetical protein